MSQAERTDGSAAQLTNSSYEWFAKAKVPGRDITIGLVPLEVIFDSGVVKFKPTDRVHDVGAGTGRSTEYIQQKIGPDIYGDVTLVASEPDEAQRAELLQRVSGVHLFALDGVTAIESIPNCDKIFLINAIHLFGEKERSVVIKAAFNALNPGGQFIISSTFIVGDVSREEQRALMIPWMRMIKDMMTEQERDKVAEGAKIHARMVKWTPQKYLDEFNAVGFDVQFSQPDVLMPLTEEGCEGIAHYKPWNDDIVPGLDTDRQIEIVTSAVRKIWYEVLKRSKDDISPRNTLVVVARKPLDRQLSF